MKRNAKYLIYMLTVVLIASVIGVAFAWYSSNTTVTATGTATAAKAENVNISFEFTEDDDKTNKIYVSEAQLISDYYNRSIYSGEEGWSAALNGMVGAVTQEGKDGKTHLSDPDLTANETYEPALRLGTRDHVFTLYYYIEIKSQDNEVNFGLNLNSVKIYKNGVTLRNTSGEEVGNAHVEYPVMNVPAEGEEAQAVGSGKIAEVTIGGTSYYFDVTQKTVYGTIEDDGTLSNAMTEAQASYDTAACKLTVGGTEYVLTGHELDKNTTEAHYFKTDAEEGTAEGSSVKNFVFNCYDITEKDFYDKDSGSHHGKLFNKAHEGDYSLYTKDDTGADKEFAKAGQTLKTQDDGNGGYVAKLIIAVTHFQKIEADEDGNLTAVDAIFPYSAKDFMEAHFKFNIKAELGK